MHVTFCGTGGGPFTSERASSGIILQHAGHTVMLDCGPGSVRGALQAGISPRQIEAVLLSHVHPDHVIDLAALVFQQVFFGWSLPIVYGPPGTAGVASAATGFIAATAAPRPAALASTIEIAGSDERQVCGFTVRSEETPHAPDVIAAVRRVSIDGKTVVYTGDTQPNPGTITPLADGVDLLVHECYSEERLQQWAATMPAPAGERVYKVISTTHTEVLQAAAIARDAGVRRLTLTHLGPWGEDTAALHAKAASVFPGEIVVAHDGLSLAV